MSLYNILDEAIGFQKKLERDTPFSANLATSNRIPDCFAEVICSDALP
jgi:hypothetical protein